MNPAIAFPTKVVDDSVIVALIIIPKTVNRLLRIDSGMGNTIRTLIIPRRIMARKIKPRTNAYFDDVSGRLSKNRRAIQARRIVTAITSITGIDHFRGATKMIASKTPARGRRVTISNCCIAISKSVTIMSGKIHSGLI
jgi:hypothetical protein